MKPSCHKLWIVGGIALYCLAPTSPTRAQIVPDGTLPVNSIVTPEGNTTLITGGTVAGSNLFHSFQQFSIPMGSTAFFNNAEAIQNIISRVTGGSVSNIDGLIRANGTANLFLLNPNGIIFGPNAQLNIGGSFLASTASSLNFADGKQFSAKAPQTTPLLTVSVPIGLQFGGTAGRILVQGPGNNLSLDPTTLAFVRGKNPVGLAVQPGKTLVLVGGDVALEGGNLIAEGGRIEVGSVAGSGLVSLTPTDFGLTLGYSGVPTYGDIQLSRRASLDASGEAGGDIQVQGRRVTLTDGSAIFALTLGSKPGGTVAVNASDSVQLIGTSADPLFPSALFTDTEGAGAAGDLRINTRQLIVRDGAEVTADTLGAGNAGSLTVNASDEVQLIGSSADGELVSGLFTTGDAGAAKDLTINTRQLLVRDGAAVSTSTFGAGDAGSLTVNASDEVKLIGTKADGEFPSGLFAETRGAGAGGALTINTGQLQVLDGAQVSAAPFGTGSGGTLAVNTSDEVELMGTSADGKFPSGLFTTVQQRATGAGGNLTLATRRLIVRDGARIAANTLGQGSGGTLTVKAKESVELSGTSTVEQRSRPSLVTARSRGTGNAGSLRIETGQLSIRDGAQATVSSEGSGNAGDLTVRVRDLLLENLAALEANAKAGEGNITVRARDLILRNNSRITTNATGTVTGGNITLDTDFLVALENSDISANAQQGSGGRVIINAQGIFGTQFRDQQTPESDITATSNRGPKFSGTVQINTPDVDPSRGLVNAADQPTETEVVQACQPGGEQDQSEFVVTGRGGLPPSPNEALSSDAIQVDWVTLYPGVENHSSPTVSTNPTAPEPAPIVEAQGWVIGDNGEVVLTATAPNAKPHNPWMNPATCHTPETSS